MSQGNNGRSEARWEGALEQLESIGLAEDYGDARQVFRLSAAGYEAADNLWRVYMLRLLNECQAEEDHRFIDVTELIDRPVFDRQVTLEFVQEKIEDLVNSEHLDGVQTEGSVSAVRLTIAGRKAIRENNWIEFAAPDVPANDP